MPTSQVPGAPSAPASATVVIERPPPGPLRGRFAVEPVWLGLLIGLVVLILAVFYGPRLRRRLKP